jgi:hypothetical protein
MTTQSVIVENLNFVPQLFTLITNRMPPLCLVRLEHPYYEPFKVTDSAHVATPEFNATSVVQRRRKKMQNERGVPSFLHFSRFLQPILPILGYS